MALTVHDCDLDAGKIQINKAVVLRRQKDGTKTREDREITLCGRAREVLERQLALREALIKTRTIDHELVFFQRAAHHLVDLNYAYDRWRYVIEQVKVRYREPYNARGGGRP